jgi:hypothetical protein
LPIFSKKCVFLKNQCNGEIFEQSTYIAVVLTKNVFENISEIITRVFVRHLAIGRIVNVYNAGIVTHYCRIGSLRLMNLQLKRCGGQECYFSRKNAYSKNTVYYLLRYNFLQRQRRKNLQRHE